MTKLVGKDALDQINTDNIKAYQENGYRALYCFTNANKNQLFDKLPTQEEAD